MEARSTILHSIIPTTTRRRHRCYRVCTTMSQTPPLTNDQGNPQRRRRRPSLPWRWQLPPASAPAAGDDDLATADAIASPDADADSLTPSHNHRRGRSLPAPASPTNVTMMSLVSPHDDCDSDPHVSTLASTLFYIFYSFSSNMVRQRRDDDPQRQLYPMMMAAAVTPSRGLAK